MKLTLLEMTQIILRSLKGEEVNNISDTAESQAVVGIIKECYYDILSTQDFPERKSLFELNASGDSTKPTLMYLPDDVVGIDWIKYDKVLAGETIKRYDYVKYLPLEDFMKINHADNTNSSNVEIMTLTLNGTDTIDFTYRNDLPPTYYTSIDDYRLVFDSFTESLESTLQKNKTVCYGLLEADWTESNSFIPELDSQQFGILLQDAKSMAWLELRQQANADAMKRTRRNKIRFLQNKLRADYPNSWEYWTDYPSYGRKTGY
jgi:hypothetical protein